MMLVDAGRVHFVGVGGAGMSAIAKVLVERGQAVSGSDIRRSHRTEELAALGVRITIGHDAAAVPADSVVVVSSAVPESNPELAAARRGGLSVMTRGAALASILEGDRSIIVAGTHGKTTTTSMIVTILRAAGLDPSYLVGGGLNDSGTNAHSGRPGIAVAESDESDGSFLLLNPHVAVVTNMELDHVDYWSSLDAMRSGFEEFLARVDPSGTAVVPAHDRELCSIAEATGRRTLCFGDDGDVYATDINLGHDATTFLLNAGDEIAAVTLRVPGRHNVANALAAAAAALGIGVDPAAAAKGLDEYRGVERRFHVRGTAGGVTVIDDYAHHPTEVKAILAAARLGPWHRVVAVFQPHRYSRTAAFAREFGDSFGDADRVVVTDVYGAGEPPVPGVTGKLVADAVGAALYGRPVAYLPHRDELIGYLGARVRPGDAVVTLGAGDITSVGVELMGRLG
jgi:UDP-N-acetylmuramate--alanine ligase